jgi:hypothetical protein
MCGVALFTTTPNATKPGVVAVGSKNVVYFIMSATSPKELYRSVTTATVDYTPPAIFCLI